MSYYSEGELAEIGFKCIGKNVRLSRKASIYNPAAIEVGSNVRIDDFCVLSAGRGGIAIGDYVHIAIYSSIMGDGRVVLESFCNISSRVAIYSSNDDYSGMTLTNPTVPPRYRNVQVGDVYFDKHCIVGACSVILPGVTLEQGVAIGALSLVKNNCTEFGIYAGSPAKKIKDRKKDLLELERSLLNDCSIKS